MFVSFHTSQTVRRGQSANAPLLGAISPLHKFSIQGEVQNKKLSNAVFFQRIKQCGNLFNKADNNKQGKNNSKRQKRLLVTVNNYFQHMVLCKRTFFGDFHSSLHIHISWVFLPPSEPNLQNKLYVNTALQTVSGFEEQVN
ncbi:MAG: hypothetical protein AB7D06_01945 [Pedobacter sp.]